MSLAMAVGWNGMGFKVPTLAMTLCCILIVFIRGSTTGGKCEWFCFISLFLLPTHHTILDKLQFFKTKAYSHIATLNGLVKSNFASIKEFLYAKVISASNIWCWQTLN